MSCIAKTCSKRFVGLCDCNIARRATSSNTSLLLVALPLCCCLLVLVMGDRTQPLLHRGGVVDQVVDHVGLCSAANRNSAPALREGTFPRMPDCHSPGANEGFVRRVLPADHSRGGAAVATGTAGRASLAMASRGKTAPPLQTVLGSGQRMWDVVQGCSWFQMGTCALLLALLSGPLSVAAAPSIVIPIGTLINSGFTYPQAVLSLQQEMINNSTLLGLADTPSGPAPISVTLVRHDFATVITPGQTFPYSTTVPAFASSFVSLPDGTRPHMIVGPVAAMEGVSGTLQTQHITAIAPISTAYFTNPNRNPTAGYPYATTIDSTSLAQGPLLAKLVANMGWQRVGVLYNTLQYLPLSQSFAVAATQLQINIISTASFSTANSNLTAPPSDYTAQVQQLKDAGVRVFVLLIFQADIMSVFTSMRTVGIVGAPYAIVGNNEWMRLLYSPSGNTLSALFKDMLQGAIGTAIGVPYLSKTYTDYVTTFRAKCARTPETMYGCAWAAIPAGAYFLFASALQAAAVTYSQLYSIVQECQGTITYVYDATTDVYSFNNIVTNGSMWLGNLPVCARYTGMDAGRMLNALITDSTRVSFNTSIGPVFLGADGTRTANYPIVNVNADGLIAQENVVGNTGSSRVSTSITSVAANVADVFLQMDMSHVLWPGGGTDIPLDQAPPPVYEYLIGLQAAAWSVSALVAVADVALLFFVARFRAHPVIKGSSVLFNIVQLACCLLLAAAGVAWSVPPSSRVVCELRGWMTSIPLTCVIGAILVKVDRVRRIFVRGTNKAFGKVVLPDSTLLLQLSVLFAMQFVLCVAYSATPITSSSLVPGSGSSSGYLRWKCAAGTGTGAWLGVQIAFIACLLVVALYDAFVTRHVPSLFNESAILAAASCLFLFFGVVLLPLQTLIGDNPNGEVVVNGIGLPFAALAFTMLFFGTKVAFIVGNSKQHSSGTMMQTAGGDTTAGQMNTELGGTTDDLTKDGAHGYLHRLAMGDIRPHADPEQALNTTSSPSSPARQYASEDVAGGQGVDVRTSFPSSRPITEGPVARVHSPSSLPGQVAY